MVQTIGFHDGLWADEMGTPITEVAKVTERFRRLNFGRLEIEVTVDDAKAYTGPWTVKLNQSFKPDTDLLETICHGRPRVVEMTFRRHAVRLRSGRATRATASLSAVRNHLFRRQPGIQLHPR